MIILELHILMNEFIVVKNEMKEQVNIRELEIKGLK